MNKERQKQTRACFHLLCAMDFFLTCIFTFNADIYKKREEKREWQVIFRVIRDVLLLCLLSIPMAWFSFIVTWFICFDHSKSLSQRTPRYFTVLAEVKSFASNLNLRL